MLNTRFRGGASSGACPIPSACFRWLPTEWASPLASWMQTLPERGLPDQWRTSLVTPLWKKKGEATDPTMYRPISVLHPMAKLFSLLMLDRLSTAAEHSQPPWRAVEQAGFRPRHRLEDHQLPMTYLLQAAAAGRGSLAVAFIDLEKAYDRVPRLLLWEVLARELGVPTDLLSGIRAMYHDCTAQVRTPGGLSPQFPTQVGVKQGCPASPVLFSLFFDRVVDFLQDNAPLHLRSATPLLAGLGTFVLLYADDLVLLAAGAS